MALLDATYGAKARVLRMSQEAAVQPFRNPSCQKLAVP